MYNSLACLYLESQYQPIGHYINFDGNVGGVPEISLE